MKTPHNPASAASMPASGGVGLGLSIARTLLEAHGATLEATSDGPGRGAKFSAPTAVALVPIAKATANLVSRRAIT